MCDLDTGPFGDHLGQARAAIRPMVSFETKQAVRPALGQLFDRLANPLCDSNVCLCGKKKGAEHRHATRVTTTLCIWPRSAQNHELISLPNRLRWAVNCRPEDRLATTTVQYVTIKFLAMVP